MKLSPEQDRRLVEACTLLRASPAFPAVAAHLQALLEDTKDQLITNRSDAVPNLQGRAQQLRELLELLNRKIR